ncbi:hypothetical protein MMC25_002843 [Agyrium rufum]|nr:hypothetical protein [Agyrium rufum]
MPALNTSHFKTLQRFKVDYAPATVTQYKSERTGMHVVTVDQSGPKVLGYFALATEILDDSGSPHTLEHLCFMGSKSYQYKGVLDKLANRAYANTNAWTATDHTAYTLDAAGWSGFAQILPVYLEHVIVPTLTDAGCYTEVHHVDGSGHDAGVVYSEMQGVQNSQGYIGELCANRLLYPEGVGFRYETGGLMENLRVLTAERIRQFHRDMYQPKNLCLVIIGTVDHQELLHILDEFESTILEDIPKPDAPFTRPWIESKQARPLEKTVIETVDFPEEDESSGEINIYFLGPDCNDDLLMAAISVILDYLASSSASVLENVLVEKEQLCSAVYYSKEPRPMTVLEFSLASVETNKLAQVESRFFGLLDEVLNHPLDMKYMADCVHRSRRQIKFAAEIGGSFFTSPVISDFLFGNRDGSTLSTLATLKEYDVLDSWTESQWKDVLRQWISNATHVSILLRPSAAMSKQLKEAEDARSADQKKRLGEAGMAKLQEKLDQAKAENDREIPRELLERFKVPDTSSIHFIKTTNARSGAARKMGELHNPIQKIIDSEKSSVPLFIHFEHIESNFVHFAVLLGTTSIPLNLKPLLSVFMENFFTSPLNRNGERLEFEQVVMELERDTVGYSMDGASGLGNPELLRIDFQVEAEKYLTAINWLKDLMTGGIIDLERIKAITAKMLADIPGENRSGSGMSHAIELMTHTSPDSIGHARNTHVQGVYLKTIKKLLATSPDTVLDQLADIRDNLFHHSNMRVMVIADIKKLSKPVASWQCLFEGYDTSKPLIPMDTRLSRLSEAGRKPGGLSFVVPMPTVDSSFCLAVTAGPSSFTDPRLPATMVAIAYLNAVEGPLWTGIRGTGLAYGASFSRQTDSGHISFDVYRSPDAFKAFAKGREVVEGFATGTIPLDSIALEGAISSIVLNFADGQASMNTAAQASFIRQVVRNLDVDWNEIILKKVRNVTFDEIKEAMKDILLPVYHAGTSNIYVTCAPNLEESIVNGFKDLEFKPEVRTLTSFQDDYGLGTLAGTDGTNEEAEDDDDSADDMSGDESASESDEEM